MYAPMMPYLPASTIDEIGESVLREAVRLAGRAAERIPTPELNKFVAGVVADRPPPQRHGPSNHARTWLLILTVRRWRPPREGTCVRGGRCAR